MYFCNNARFLFGVVTLALLTACASTPQTQEVTRHPPAHIRPKVVLKEVAFFPQQQYQCGPAALATVLDYQGISVNIDDLKNKVYIPERKGSLQLEMIATARSHGLLSYKINPDLGTLLTEIDAGNPVLVFQNLSLDIWPQWHYAVAVGYDLIKAELILHSGTIRHYKISFSTFERTWQRAKYWAYVFVPAGKIPFTATPLNYTQACKDLQQSGFSAAALKAFRQGAIKWPGDSIVLMSLGNAEYAAGNYTQATVAFSRELDIRALNANAWNNLAYALAAKNCRTKAIKAIQCASRIAPDDVNIQKSLQEIQAMPVTNTGSCEITDCPD